MFEKTIAAFEKLGNTIQDAENTKSATTAKIKKTYKDDATIVQKLDKMNKAYTEAVDQAKAEAIEVIKADISSAREAVKQVVLAPVSDAFGSELSVIIARNASLTEYEFNAYLDKYKDCYPAYRALVGELAPKFQFARQIVVTDPGTIENEMLNNEITLINAVNSYQPLATALMVFGNSSIIRAMDTNVTNFINGNWSEHVSYNVTSNYN